MLMVARERPDSFSTQLRGQMRERLSLMTKSLALIASVPLAAIVALLIFDRKSWRTAPESAIDRVPDRIS